MSANEPLPPELIENLDLPDSTISTDQTTQYYNITSILYYIFQTPQYQRTRHHNITIFDLYYITSSRLHNINGLDITILQYYIHIILHLPDSTISTDQTSQYYNITSILYYIFQTQQYQQTRQHNITILHLRQKPRGVSHSRRRSGFPCLVILSRLREAALGFCLRIIVNEFHPNHKMTTSIVLSVILINPWAEVTMSKNN